jgi:hypothetical protein
MLRGWAGGAFYCAGHTLCNGGGGIKVGLGHAVNSARLPFVQQPPLHPNSRFTSTVSARVCHGLQSSKTQFLGLGFVATWAHAVVANGLCAIRKTPSNHLSAHWPDCFAAVKAFFTLIFEVFKPRFVERLINLRK